VKRYTHFWKLLKILNLSYTLTSLPNSSQEYSLSQEFLNEKVIKKPVNILVVEQTKQLVELLNTIYRNSYIKYEKAVSGLNVLLSFIEVFYENTDIKTLETIFYITDQVFPEVNPHFLHHLIIRSLPISSCCSIKKLLEIQNIP